MSITRLLIWTLVIWTLVIWTQFDARFRMHKWHVFLSQAWSRSVRVMEAALLSQSSGLPISRIADILVTKEISADFIAMLWTADGHEDDLISLRAALTATVVEFDNTRVRSIVLFGSC